MKKMTIKELAEISGFSTSTISRVLANTGNVKEETRQEVERLLVENKYRPGVPGTRMAKTIQRTILIVVNDPSNEFYLRTIRTIQTTCLAAGHLPVVGITNDNPELEAQYVMTAQDASFAGIILMTPSETDTLRNLVADSSVPVVLVNRYLRSLDLDVVCIDNYRGGYLAAEYLVGRGLRRVCHLAGPQESSASRDRRRGFQDALGDLGIAVSEKDIYPGDLLRSCGRDFAKRLLDKKPRYDGIFFANDMMAAGFIDVARKRDVRIPEDISIICFDDSPAVTEGVVPVTSVSSDSEALGEQAAAILLRRIAGSDEPPVKLVYPPILHERQSVAAPKR